MESAVLREPSPYEKRSIVRHNLGFYSNVVVGAIYSIPTNLVEESRLQQLNLYASALMQCIKQHPFLSATIRDAATNHPVWVRPERLDLNDHFRIIRADDFDLPGTPQHDEVAMLSRAMEQLLNHPRYRFTCVDSKPAWALDVMPLTNDNSRDKYRVVMFFTYSHSHGDGMSGVAFHTTFYEALSRTLQSNERVSEMTVEPPFVSLPDQPDTSSTMPISWSYLLRPALGTYLPAFLSSALGISENANGVNGQTWTGSPKFTDTETPGAKGTSSVEMLTLSARILRNVLAVCKRKGGKLTPLLNHLIAQAMSSALAASGKELDPAINFVSQTPVNFRKALAVPAETIGNYIGIAYLSHNFDPNSAPLDESSWKSLRFHGQDLLQAASSLSNQPVGLLRYISDFRAWLQSQIGRRRDCSWELSNLGSFDLNEEVMADQKHAVLGIKQALFVQSASTIVPPLTFNVAGVKDGNLNICVSWQVGALGLPHNDASESAERQDRRFVRDVLTHLSDGLEQLGKTA